MSVILDAKQVSKTYALGRGNVHQALKNVSLRIAEGEFVSVMGPSGCGKSTLLYNISGMDRADGGSVEFAGRDVVTLSETELSNLRLTKMGFVFQQSNLLKNLSIFDNIIVAAYLDGRERQADVNRRAAELMERTGIGHLKDNDVTQASGGEAQRAAICRALVNNPAILFGDEPTGALNSSSTNDILDIFCDINRRGGTILLVTHDARVAARGNRVLFMTDGQIIDEYKFDQINNANMLENQSNNANTLENQSDNANTLEKTSPGTRDWKTREAGLSKWLAEMGF